MKEKRIKEMAKVLCGEYNPNCYKDCCCSHDCNVEYDCRTLYNAGYRKQSEGVWVGDWDYECSVCHEYHDFKTNFCPNCGAKMKGGVE